MLLNSQQVSVTWAEAEASRLQARLEGLQQAFRQLAGRNQRLKTEVESEKENLMAREARFAATRAVAITGASKASSPAEGPAGTTEPILKALSAGASEVRLQQMQLWKPEPCWGVFGGLQNMFAGSASSLQCYNFTTFSI